MGRPNPVSLTLSAQSSNLTLAPLGGIAFGGAEGRPRPGHHPRLEQSGTAIITITVSDLIYTASTSFVLTVDAVNDIPMLFPIGDQMGDELTTISFTASAMDMDLPPDTLTFSLDPGEPTGASIDPFSGEFTWTPGEDQGPGVYPVTVRVTDNGIPAKLSAKPSRSPSTRSTSPPC